jgi:hypothetical protein
LENGTALKWTGNNKTDCKRKLKSKIPIGQEKNEEM